MSLYWMGFFAGAFIADGSSRSAYGKLGGLGACMALDAIGFAVALAVHLS